MRNLCISAYPRIYPNLHRWFGNVAPLAAILRKFENRLVYFQNSRSADYMESAASLQIGDFTMAMPSTMHLVDWQNFDRVVLLWPDGNGLGWRPIEQRVLAAARPDAEVWVLNGRRRLFRLSEAKYLLLRRFLEKTGLVDMAVALTFIVCTPFLLAADFARGKR